MLGHVHLDLSFRKIVYSICGFSFPSILFDVFSQHVSCVCVVATLKLSDLTCLKPNSASLEIGPDENELLLIGHFVL